MWWTTDRQMSPPRSPGYVTWETTGWPCVNESAVNTTFTKQGAISLASLIDLFHNLANIVSDYLQEVLVAGR